MDYSEFLSQTFLFNGISEKEIVSLVGDSYEIRDFKRGELIFSCDNFKHKIGFVYSGECEIKSRSGVTLNILHTPSSFGVTAVFSKKEKFPTNIYAKKATRILFINAADLCGIMINSNVAVQNLIAFLVERIDFLNERVATYTGDSVEDKLLSYLSNKSESGEIILNYKRAAEALSVSRPSVYRAVSSLENKGLIIKNDKNIIICRKEKTK